MEDAESSQLLLKEHIYIPEEYSGAVQDFVTAPLIQDESVTTAMLRDILNSPAFRKKVQPMTQGETVFEKLARWLDQTMSSIGRALGVGAGNGGKLLIYVLVVLALALMAMLIRQLITSSGTRDRRRQRDREDEPEGILDLLRLAERHARDGDFRQALRYRYLATLQSLDLPSSTLTTNSMLIRQVLSTHPKLHREFRSLVGIFEDAWYGCLETGSRQYQEALALAGSLDSQIAIRQEGQH